MANQIPAFSEEAIALSLVREDGANWLYATDLGAWFRWTDSLWKIDDTNLIFNRAREACRKAAALAAKEDSASVARGLASAHTRAAVVSLLSSDRALVVTNRNLDTDPMMLGTPGGCVDLRTGELLPADRAHRTR